MKWATGLLRSPKQESDKDRGIPIRGYAFLVMNRMAAGNTVVDNIG